MLAGLADPVLDSQRIFRSVLDAMSHPGRIVSVDPPSETPEPLWAATASVCLALADLETPLWLDAAARQQAVIDYFRFHCGCAITSEPRAARFGVIADPRRMPTLDAFDVGSDEYPDRSATVIIQVESLAAGSGRRLAGPGIADEVLIDARGLPDGFWHAVLANRALFPRGVDLILAARDTIVGLPRSTRVSV
jgi:alpha-D-ribose 1-methylphosphonate 5-triphosphate synthase subunit PhnH